MGMTAAPDLCPILGCYWECSCQQDQDTADWKQAMVELEEAEIPIRAWRAEAEQSMEIGDES